MGDDTLRDPNSSIDTAAPAAAEAAAPGDRNTEPGPAGEAADPVAAAQEEAKRARADLESAKRAADEANRESVIARESAVKVAQDAAEAVVKLAKQAEQAALQAEHQARSAAELASQGAEVKSHLLERHNQIGFFFGIIPTALLSAVLFWVFLYGPPNFLGGGSQDMTLVAHAVQAGAPHDRGAYREQDWIISGALVSAEALKNRPQVFAVMTDEMGNRFTASTHPGTGARAVGENGGGDSSGGDGDGDAARWEWTFEIPVKQRFSGDTRPTVEEIVVSAAGTKDFLLFFDSDLSASITLTPEIGRASRWTAASGTPFMASMILLAIAFMLSLWHTVNPIILRAEYYATVLMALAFTAFMVVFISTTSQELAGSNRTEEVISLGFAHVFFGKYVDDADPEWLLSLTTPVRQRVPSPQVPGAPGPVARDIAGAAGTAGTAGASGGGSAQAVAGVTGEVAPDSDTVVNIQVAARAEKEVQQTGTGLPAQPDAAASNTAPNPGSNPGSGPVTYPVSRGFGAPLWVILLAVVGSAVFLIRLVVDSLRTSVTFAPKFVRERMSQIVRHQVYIVFAPLGAIFVYQLLVAAGSASETITVGLAALAAGIALNSLLEKAWKSAETTVVNH